MKSRTVGIITYNFPHLKTEQVIQGLLNTPPSLLTKLKIYALPFVERKPREVLINHRPNQIEAIAPQEIAYKHQIEFSICQKDTDIDNSCDLYIITGSGIISSECILGKKIINCHPGIIPSVRGLDAFKWTIFDMKPLGVTIHYIDSKVDEGEIIAVIPTEVYRSDSFAILARRHYENEINTLINFDKYLEKPINNYAQIEMENARKRMPLNVEKEVAHKFHEYVEKYGTL